MPSCNSNPLSASPEIGRRLRPRWRVRSRRMRRQHLHELPELGRPFLPTRHGGSRCGLASRFTAASTNVVRLCRGTLHDVHAVTVAWAMRLPPAASRRSA
jgi:hypothetical protein